MSFNFSNTTGTSAGSSGSLFGPASTNNDGKSIFGANSGSAGWNFGQTPASTAGTEGQAKTASSFGGGAISSGNLFGNKQDDKTTETSKQTFSNFGGFGGTSQAPGTPAQSTTTNIFGSTTPAASGNMFGKMNSSTTPAGQPPAGSLFGASTGATSQSQPGSTPSFNFGKPTTSSSDQQTTAVTQAPTSLFSNPGTPSSSSLFSKPGSIVDTGSKPSSFSGFSFQKPAESSQSKPAPAFSFMQPKADDKPADPAPKNDQPKPSGFSFPAAPTSSSTTSQTTAPHSTAPNPFSQQATSSQSKPSIFTPTTTSASSSNIFAKPAPPTSQATEAPKTGGFSFPSLGSMQPPSTSTQSETASATSKPLFSGFGSNQQSSSVTNPSPSATTAATAPSLFSSGGATATTTEPTATTSSASTPFVKLGGTTTSSAAPTTTATASFFNPSATATSTSAPAQNAASAPSTAATTTTAPSAGLGTSTLSASTTGPLAPVQSRLRNKTMDEILTRWASDLTRYTKEFKTHAEALARWDQIIVDNSAKIDKLYVKTRTCEKQTMSVEMQLSAVENQQNELEAWLNKYENDVDEMLAKDSGQSELGGPDQERERTYQLAQRLGEQLDDMSRDLQSMVEEINAANASLGKNSRTDEPVTQIVKILNSHLSQLQAIDQGTNALQTKITAAQKVASGMNYLNGSMNGDSRTAADGFYRSYMGRR